MAATKDDCRMSAHDSASRVTAATAASSMLLLITALLASQVLSQRALVPR
jgi:hypothetical protein